MSHTLLDKATGGGDAANDSGGCVHVQRGADVWRISASDAMVWCMDMDARVIARAYYQGSARCLGDDLAALSQNPQGVVVFFSRLVVLMKPVLHDRPGDWGSLSLCPHEPDGWYVHLLVGDLTLARRLASDLAPLHWLCFQRGRRSSRPHVRLWRRILINHY